MAIGFDKLTSDVNFDWLGDIPGKLEASRIRDVRKQSLANINVNDSKSLMSAGTKLFNAGDFEGGLKLIEQGKGLKQAETAAFSQEQYLAYLQSQKDKKEGSIGVGPAAERYDPFFPAPSGARAPAPAGGGAPSWLSPDVLKGVPGAAPGPRAEVMPDYENAPPYRVAGPVPAREGPLGPAAPGDETFGPVPPAGARSVIPPGTLPTAPEAPRQAAPPAGIPGDPIAAEAASKAGEALDELKRAPGGAPGAAARQAAYAKARYYISQATSDNEKKNWWIFNLDRMRDAAEEGNTDIRPLNFGQYKLQESIAKDQFLSGEKLYTGTQDKRRKMEELKPALDRLESVLNHPAFTSGPGSGTIESAKALFRGSKDWLVANGVPIPEHWQNAVDNATTSTALREVFTSMVNSVIFDKLGSLGAQTSDRDLTFTKETFPSIHLSKEGNRMIIEYYQDVIKKNKELAVKIQDAYGKFKERGKAFDQHEIDKISTAFWNDPKNLVLGDPSIPDGKGLTDLGRRMFRQDALNKEKYPGGAPRPEPGSGLYGEGKKALEAAVEDPRAPADRGPMIRPGSPLDWAGRKLGLIPEGPPEVGGGAGAVKPPAGRLPTFTGPDGRKYTWGPNGEHIPVEGP